jgi:hypothetical protein
MLLDVLMPKHMDTIFIFMLFIMLWKLLCRQYIFNMLLLLFQNIFFVHLTLFSVRMATQEYYF